MLTKRTASVLAAAVVPFLCGYWWPREWLLRGATLTNNLEGQVALPQGTELCYAGGDPNGATRFRLRLVLPPELRASGVSSVVRPLGAREAIQ